MPQEVQKNYKEYVWRETLLLRLEKKDQGDR